MQAEEDIKADLQKFKYHLKQGQQVITAIQLAKGLTSGTLTAEEVAIRETEKAGTEYQSNTVETTEQPRLPIPPFEF